MAAPRQGGFPPLFWIILAGLAVMAAVAFFLYGGEREGVGADVSTPLNRELGPPPAVRPPDAMPGSPTVTSPNQQPVAPSGAGPVAETPATGVTAPNVDAPAPPPAD